MTTPVSIRFTPSLLARLRQRANAVTGASVAGLAQQLIDEGLRMADHTDVIFKDGPSGRWGSTRNPVAPQVAGGPS